MAVLGEMKELGPTARALHVQVGEDVIEAGVSLLIGCGGLAHETVARARAGGVGSGRLPGRR